MNKYGLEADISYFESCEELCEKSDFNRGGIMTINEIIETLKVAKAEVEWNYPLDYVVAIEQAIKELKSKKQIPMKPKFFINLSDCSSVFECTECGERMKVRHNRGVMNNHNGSNYCPNCGQKLDWSEVDE